MFGRKGVNVAIVLGIVDMLLTLICDVADFFSSHPPCYL